MDAAGNAGLHTDREVRVTCNGTYGTFLLPTQTVQCHCARCCAGGNAPGGQGAGAQQAPAITPTEFERHSGLLTAKKWRNSIRLVQGDGTITIGKWLEQHNILPRPKCSGGPLGSPGPGGSGTVAMAFGHGHGADGHGHQGGPSSGNDSHTGGAAGGPGMRIAGDQQPVPALRCTLPPSRYPASEYVTGEDDEYDEMGTQLGGADEEGDDGEGAAEDCEGNDDEDYQDGQYMAVAEAHAAHAGGRGGRRVATQRVVRPGGSGNVRLERRGLARAPVRPTGQGLSRTLLARHRNRHVARSALVSHMHRAAGMAGSSPGGAQLRGSGSGGSGAVDARRGGVRGASSQEEDAGRAGGGGKGHSSSEGSPPSGDRDGSGGSGEGDGSGTGDGGDSRRAPAPGGEGDRRTGDGADPQGSRRSGRHPQGATKAPQQQQSGREGSMDAGATQDRSTRHAAAIKRLPEYLTGTEIGTALKRARTRPSGTASGVGGGGASAEELTAMYDMAAAGPQVHGWRFLGAAAGAAADQVLISVTINGRTYTGLLAPQQSVPQAVFRAPPAAPAASNGAFSGRKQAAGRVPTSSTGRTLPPLGPSSRLGLGPAAVVPKAVNASPRRVAAEEPEAAMPLVVAELAEPALAALEDGAPDDGHPPDCPRCALCHRCAAPVLALLPPSKTPGDALPADVPAPLSDSAEAKAGASGDAGDGGSPRSMTAQSPPPQDERKALMPVSELAVLPDSSAATSAVVLRADEEAEGAKAASTKIIMKSEDDSATTTTTGAAAPAALLPAAEASRTARQAGSGLGPLVEVRCSAVDGGAAVSVHSQCALWSPDVFLIGGTMYGVPAVVKRGRARRCAHCNRSGATLSCCSAKCGRVYHLPCAIEAGAMLVAEPYSMACPEHRNAVALHPATSQPLSRLPAPRLRTAPSQDASQSTTTTVAIANPAALAAGGVQMQVLLPASLQMAADRRAAAGQPLMPPPSAPELATAASRPSRGADASSLPALMMLRGNPDGAGYAALGDLPSPTSPSMPPPRAVGSAAAANATAADQDQGQGGAGATRGADQEMMENDNSGDGDDGAAEAEAAAKRPRASLERPWRSAGDSRDDAGGMEGETGALTFGPAAWSHVFERRQAAAAAAAAAAAGGGGIGAAMNAAATLAGLYGGSMPAGMSSGQLEMSAVSEGTAVVNSQAQGQLKRRRDAELGGEGDAEAAAATANDLSLMAARRDGASSGAGLAPQQQQRGGQAVGPGMPLVLTAGRPAMFLSRTGSAGGNDLSLDQGGGLRLSQASALALLQQQHGGALPEGVAMLLSHAQKQQQDGGEGSVGSPFANHLARGAPGGGGRPRHQHHQTDPAHHHHHHHHHHHPAMPGNSGSTASASTGNAFGRALSGLPVRSGSGGGGDESPTQLAAQLAAGMMHVLPRAARNIEGLLPSRPLLHNPYVPSSGDPSADLTLSKIAQNGSREVEAELLGGTTGRAGHSGRCAVCVIQRKGKCGTESAPKKCLRRQLVALQRATNGNGPSATTPVGAATGAVGGLMVPPDEVEEQVYVEQDASPQPYMDERVATAAAEQRARERARRETWSLPLGQGSGATGKRPPQHFAAA